LAEFTNHDRILALKADAKLLLCDHNYKTACACSLRNGNYDVDIFQRLFPDIREGLEID
jgi:hypothetical protein